MRRLLLVLKARIEVCIIPFIHFVLLGLNVLLSLSLEDSKAEHLTKEDAVSTVPEMKGDWVLFHPVYSPEELRSVEVSTAFAMSAQSIDVISPTDYAQKGQESFRQGCMGFCPCPKVFIL